MSLKQLIISFASLLLLEVNTFASNLKDSMSFGFNTYNDSADVDVYSPTFSLFKKVSHNWMLGFKMRIDAISAASIRNGANGGHIDAVITNGTTGASSMTNAIADDVRFAPTLMATYDDGENTLTFGGYYSQENDYIGRAVFANYVRQLNQQNTALGICVSQSFDNWYPVFDRDLPRDNRNETKVDFSVNQLILPTFSMQAVYSYMYSQGFLSSPYHYVLQDDIARFENYPETRTGHAIAIKGVHLLNNTNSMNFSYRYYFDDWDISSHTVNVEELHDFSSRFTSGLRLRYYTQTGSNFIKDIGDYKVNEDYYATDYRMSAFDSYTIGIPFMYRFKGGNKLKASIDYYQTTDNEHIKSWYGVDKISAVFTSLSFEFDY